MTTSDPTPQDDLTAKVRAAKNTDDQLATLEQKVLELTEQLKSYSESSSRSQAELQNAKIRLEREAGEMRKFAAEGVLLKLLPTIDNLQRALKHLPEKLLADTWVQGIVVIEQQLLKEVGDMGLIRFESLGQPLDAERHEVLMQIPGAAGTVMEVLEDGYELHGKVVRPAKVKVGGA